MDSRTRKFMETDLGMSIQATLEKMSESTDYKTDNAYSPSDANGLGFVEKQMTYMSQYPNLNYEQYISNLKLKTRIK